jgi:hypothetical protein
MQNMGKQRRKKNKPCNHVSLTRVSPQFFYILKSEWHVIYLLIFLKKKNIYNAKICKLIKKFNNKKSKEHSKNLDELIYGLK